MEGKRITRKDLKILLLQKDLTLAQIAEKIGKSPAAVTLTLQGKLQNKKTRESIARIVGVNASDLFAL